MNSNDGTGDGFRLVLELDVVCGAVRDLLFLTTLLPSDTGLGGGVQGVPGVTGPEVSRGGHEALRLLLARMDRTNELSGATCPPSASVSAAHDLAEAELSATMSVMLLFRLLLFTLTGLFVLLLVLWPVNWATSREATLHLCGLSVILGDF